MIICHKCGTGNPETAKFCDECGTRIDAAPAPPAVQAVPEAGTPAYVPPATDPTVPPPAPAELPQSAHVTEADPTPPVMPAPFQAETTAPTETAPVTTISAKLVIERGDGQQIEFPLSGTEATIGRWDADNGVFPDVDLDQYDAEAKVSRRHARIKIANGRYTIEDLGSTNGTYVNRGRRLLPGNPHLIEDNDEVIVGKTFLRFRTNK
ncbi:MAG: serine/threonine protein kinase [Acidobacteria bacterium OLB17]|nr:MAG: serine/threonine protein kinase [Acidobacteria bacterium OLB17]MCZ2392054.1 FHA domain-containing protein [Acidobacteriota bacterium]